MLPIPPRGCIVPIATDSGRINAEVIESRERGLVLKADGHLLGIIPARPFKAWAAGLLAQQSGATYWTVRLMSVADRPTPSVF